MEHTPPTLGEILAQTIKDDGSEGYYSLLITHVDSPIESVEDVLTCDGSLTFGNGDPNSTSGFLVPSYYVFALNGVDPADCYGAVLNANHETNALAVANKQVDFAQQYGIALRPPRQEPARGRCPDQGGLALAADPLRPDGLAC